ncbi:MAG: hypothetical protein ABEN55_06250, partial [Bradymonadaceae bacterium]
MQANPLVVDAYDSTLGPYEPGGFGRTAGANGGFDLLLDGQETESLVRTLDPDRELALDEVGGGSDRVEAFGATLGAEMRGDALASLYT